MLLGLFGLRLIVLAQATQPSIGGVVRDAESGAPLAQAVVALPDLDRSVATDSLGRYVFLDVPSGPQHLTVRRISYAPRTLHAFVPDQGRLGIDITLHSVPMQLTQLVVRTAPAIRGLEADSSRYLDREMSLEAIHNDPFLSEPDEFLALSGAEVATAPESPSGMHVRGAPSDQTGYVLDGVPVFSPYHAAGVFSAWNPDAVERVQLSSVSPSPAYPAALSGTVSGATRPPGSVLSSQGSMSTAQARLEVDGPLGFGGAGFLASVRKSYPAWYAPHDPSYLGGQTQDALAKLDAPLSSGNLQLVFYETGNSIGATARTLATGPVNNQFQWASRSLGAEWSRRTRMGTLRLQGWGANLEAEATWLGASPVDLISTRDDQGVQAVLQRSGPRSSTMAGLRYEWSQTRYHSSSLDTVGSLLEIDAHTPVATGFVQHQQRLAVGVTADGAISASTAAGDVFLNLQGGLEYQVAPPVRLYASYVRAHQFAQSLRNSESIVGNIFPAELFVGAGGGDVPVARTDRGIVALDFRPAPSFRIGIQGYLSGSSGLVLVAPSTGEPFAVSGFTNGSGSAPGVAVSASLRGSRYALLASYSWQRARLEYGDSAYQPSYADSRDFELGGIVFPTATSSVRLSLSGAEGRRATALAGDFEWEACNLVDHGCEFRGTPLSTGPLGATQLPSYLRLDLSLRQHWHLHVGRRDMLLALYGTFSNLLARTNVLTVATDPVSGRTSAVEMRPRAPLVIGVDWRF